VKYFFLKESFRSDFVFQLRQMQSNSDLILFDCFCADAIANGGWVVSELSYPSNNSVWAGNQKINTKVLSLYVSLSLSSMKIKIIKKKKKKRSTEDFFHHLSVHDITT
jgi:hypothetical protein